MLPHYCIDLHVPGTVPLPPPPLSVTVFVQSSCEPTSLPKKQTQPPEMALLDLRTREVCLLTGTASPDETSKPDSPLCD